MADDPRLTGGRGKIAPAQQDIDAGASGEPSSVVLTQEGQEEKGGELGDGSPARVDKDAFQGPEGEGTETESQGVTAELSGEKDQVGRAGRR